MTMPTEPARPVRVLTIDGGGIRGIIPALVLDYLETSTKRPTSQLFDVLVGTSTGGILALGLTVPGTDGKPAYAARDLAGLYPLWGKRIFPTGGNPTLRERILGRGDTFMERMGNAGRTIGAPFGGNPMYGGNARHTPSGLEDALDAYFGPVALSQALLEVVVTSFDATNGRPFLFSRSAARTRPELNFEMRVAARATSAAPTFFPPQLITINNSSPLELLDGGMWANNPAVIGYHEAIRIASERRLTADSVLVVSLGTGSSPTTGGAFKGSWLDAFRGLAQLATDTNVNDFLIGHQLAAGPPKRYWRFQTFDAAAAGHMDDPTPERIQALVVAANSLIEANAAELDRLGTVLTLAQGTGEGAGRTR
jgi:patatin-like phospholipase/acyl hydrolase